MDSQEDKVRQALAEFLRRHSADTSNSSIDDIVLSYLVGILEEIGSDGTEDAFNVEEFTEMMDAYLPGFSDIPSAAVCDWVFGLAAKLGETPHKDTPELTFIPKEPVALAVPATTESQGQKRTHSISEWDIPPKEQNGRSPKVSESESYEDDEQVDLLMEMFPSSCEIEVTHCLCVAGGDAERAAQLILHRQESGESIKGLGKQGKKLSAFHRNSAPVDEVTMKKHLLERYSYVDTDDDKKEHRPVMPKVEPKKLVRYLDNKVVSTKGERFTEIKKDDAEEVKKTTVNLKPAKQYRFH